jgi:N-acetylglutamate synthase-like GNAT family acetyltransferase
MIIPFENPLLIPKLVKLAEIVPNTPTEKLKKFMFATLNKTNTKAYVDYLDGEIRGFIYASIEEFDGEKCVFIQFCVIRPDDNERYVGFELLNKMKLWAIENNISQIYFLTHRDPKGFIRKYHFEEYGVVLKMDLNKERKNERTV